MKGMAIDEVYILRTGDNGPKSKGLTLREMSWSSEFAPQFHDVLRLLCLTSQRLTNRYTTTE